MGNDDKTLIRNSTAEFLVFTAQAGEKSIEELKTNGVEYAEKQGVQFQHPKWWGEASSSIGASKESNEKEKS